MRGIILNKVDANKSFAIILSIVLIALLLASFMLISNAFQNAEEAYAATEDGIWRTDYQSGTSYGNFSWTKAADGYNNTFWTDGGVGFSLAANESITFTYTLPSNKQITKLWGFASVLLDGSQNKISVSYNMQCGNVNVFEECTAPYSCQKTFDSPQQANLTYTITNTSGQAGTLHVHNSFDVYIEDAEQQVNVTKGTGVKSVYLSDTSTATSGSASGTNFGSGVTVYAFAELAKGYKAKSGWTRVSGTADTEGAKYRVSSQTVGTSTVNFGTISADLITYSISYTLNNGTHGSTHPTSYNVNTNTITISNPTREGYTFKGWSGTGLSGDSNKDIQIAKGSIGNRTYTANWTKLPDMDVTVHNYEGVYDGNEHGISIIHTTPNTGYTVRYGTTQGTYNQTSLPYTDVGVYTVYFKITHPNYYPYTGSATITIQKQTNVVYSPEPAIIENLEYTGLDQALIMVGETNVGDIILYSLDGENWSKDIPTGKNVGTYTVYYKVPEDDNQSGIEVKTLTVTISEVDKTELKENIDEAIAYLETIKDTNPEIAAVLDAGINILIDDYRDNENVNEETIADAINDAKILLSEAKVDVAKEDISRIGDVEYTKDSKALIDAAREAYDALSDIEKDEVATKDVLEAAEELYNAVDKVVKEIEATIPAYTEEYKDAIDSAKDNYEALTDEQKEIFPSDTKQELDDKELAYDVMNTVNAIGNVEYTPESKEKIEIAKQQYENLTLAQKEFVVNSNELFVAKENYDKVDEVVNKIENIGKIEYTKETKESIDEARKYFDSLTDEQKALIPTTALDTLKEGEHSYNLRHGWGMTFLVLGIIIAFVGFIYLLMFFAFNRYTIKDNKVIRVHFMGEEYGQIKLLTYNLQIIYRTGEEVFRYKGFADKLIVKDEKVD